MIRFCLAVTAGLLLAAGSAQAQFPSNYSGAAVLAVDAHAFGAYVPITSNSIGAITQLRLSFLPGVDFGFQGGLSRLDRKSGSKTLLRLGTDVKFQLVHADESRPIDMSIGAGLGVFAGDNYNTLSLGPNFIASRSWRRGAAGELTPYAGVGLAVTTINAGTSNGNDVSVPVRVGCELGITSAARLVAEFTHRLSSTFGEATDFVLGVNLPF